MKKSGVMQAQCNFTAEGSTKRKQDVFSCCNIPYSPVANQPKMTTYYSGQWRTFATIFLSFSPTLTGAQKCRPDDEAKSDYNTFFFYSLAHDFYY